MKQLYDLVGISRQAHHQNIKRCERLRLEEEILLEEVRKVRLDHPRMGMVKLYDLLQPPTLGRDRFVRLLKNNGLGLNKTKNYRRTTYSIPHLAYENKISGVEITSLNRLWVSDITYFWGGLRHYYLTFIMDVYSRRIVGYAASDSLAAQANMSALRMAIQLRNQDFLVGLTHHSDRGSQYIYGEYIRLLKNHSIEISMGNKAWENAHAERLNGTIKNDYLYPKGSVKSLKGLNQKLKKQVYLYNHERPHQELPERLNPVAFEQLAAQKQLDYKVKINY